ncbi:MAG: AAA family ATPase [Paracoccaceae bacterium]
MRNRKLVAAGSEDRGDDLTVWYQLINDDDRDMIKRRAIRFLERLQSLSGMGHLPDPAKTQLNALRDGVSVTHIHTEHKADEIAAALHAEMPWMGPATEEVWHGLRRSAREGLPGVRFNPLVLVGSPGIGKSFWARRLAHHLAVPTTKIEATGEPGTFSLVGTQRGWSSATPGKLMQTVLRERHAGPLVIVDEIEKTGDVSADNGTRHTLTDALLPLLERMTAEGWECPFYQIRFDMSWANWVLTANSRKGMWKFCRPDIVDFGTFFEFLIDECEIELKSVLINDLSHGGKFDDQPHKSDDIVEAAREAIAVVRRFAEGLSLGHCL